VRKNTLLKIDISNVYIPREDEVISVETIEAPDHQIQRDELLPSIPQIETVDTVQSEEEKYTDSPSEIPGMSNNTPNEMAIKVAQLDQEDITRSIVQVLEEEREKQDYELQRELEEIEKMVAEVDVSDLSAASPALQTVSKRTFRMSRRARYCDTFIQVNLFVVRKRQLQNCLTSMMMKRMTREIVL
jgi:hypothetical protein